MAIEAVREYLKQFGRDGDVLEFDVSSATVELAAQALQVEPARIAKTIALRDGDGCVLIVAAGDGKIDNSRFKKKFGMKAKMLAPEETVALTGHAVGGICPFANPFCARVFLDVSLKRFENYKKLQKEVALYLPVSCRISLTFCLYRKAADLMTQSHLTYHLKDLFLFLNASFYKLL